MSEQEKEMTPANEDEGLNNITENSDQGGEQEVKTVDDVAQEETLKLDDLEEEKEYTDQEYDEMVKLYQDTITDFVEGEVIVGKILAISEKEVAVDIGFKSEGTIPVEEFSNTEEMKVGDDIEVYLDNIEDKEGQLVLSKKKADFMRTWEEVMNKYETGEVIEGRCVRRIKGGIVVDIQGIDAFLPGSQIDVKPIRDFDAYIGRTISLKIVKVNNIRKNIVVSHRVLLEEKLVDKRRKILEELHKDQVLEGAVKNITDFGVFIDLGGADGLLHINDLSWGRVNHPSEIVALDEKISVKVLDFNETKDRISLGLKQLQPHPWENIEQKYPEGEVVKGKVVNISDYGAFVELEKGVEGLIHISEMSWTQHIKHPSKILAVGETVEAKILSVDVENKKISLGLKQLEPDPWDQLEEKYPVDSLHKGKVRNLTNFGAFVELEEGIDGLIHISDLSWTKKVRHPAEVVKKGDTIEVLVLNVDRDNRRISLGYKQVHDSPWDSFEGKYQVNSIVTGKVVRLIEKGVIAELNDEVDGFIPFSHLAKPNLGKPSDGYKVGDELELCIIEFDKEGKKIVCSERIEHAHQLIRQRVENGEIDTPIFEGEVENEKGDSDAKKSKKKPKAEKKAEADDADIKEEEKSETADSTPAEEKAADAAETTEKEAPAEAEKADAEEKKTDDTSSEESKAESDSEPVKKKKSTSKKTKEEQPESADDAKETKKKKASKKEAEGDEDAGKSSEDKDE